MEQDSRARWVVLSVMALGGPVEEVTPADARDLLEAWLDADDVESGPPPGVDVELWQLRKALGVA